jgi:hypothetical protein
VQPSDSSLSSEARSPGSINGWEPPDETGDARRLNFASGPDDRLVHQVFRFPAKFHAPVVRTLLSEYTSPGARVLDCFVGSGTLLVEAAVAGRHAVGFDVDPLSVFLSSVKAASVDPAAVRAGAETLASALAPIRRPPTEYRDRIHEDLDDESFAQEARGLRLPAIPRLDHWFRRYVQIDLARLRNEIDRIEVPSEVRDILRLVFASIIRGASNADPVPVSGLERTKHMLERDRVGRLIDPFALFARRLDRTLNDVAAFQELRDPSSVCRADRADATERLPLGADEGIDAVLTSPPYHGAVDYYRRHQLEMFWLDLTKTHEHRLQLLDQYLGRPHVPQRHRFVLNTELLSWEQAAANERRMREQTPRRADEFRHYCIGMSRTFARLAEVLRPGSPAIFVVGNSRWKGSDLDTSNLLAELSRPAFRLDDHLWYPVRNRHMSYGRHNGANIDREYVLVLRRI